MAMRCEQARELLPAYVDEHLDEEAFLEVHLATCADCSALLAEYRTMLDDLRVLKDRGELTPIDLVERVLASIPSPTIRARVQESIRAHPVLATVASVGGVAVVGAATVGVALLRRRALAAA
jgi:anti-sigma factor RsiW